MDAWTELTQAVIRDRIREREAEAARERLATVARSAATRMTAALRALVSLPASVAPERETVRPGEPMAARTVACEERPVGNAA